jgi:hypothetical protein
MNRPNLTQAMAERDRGMSRALGAAERLHEGWADIAYLQLMWHAKHHRYFISEDVSDTSRLNPSFPQPSTDRAWGPVYRQAAKAGMIVMDGTGRSRRRHHSLCPRWRSLVYPGF